MEDAIRNACHLVSQTRGQQPGVEVELEARIKGPIVRRDTVARLLEWYDVRDSIEYVELRSGSGSGTQSIVYRCIDEANVVCKSKAKSYKLPNEWVSITISLEIDTGNRETLARRHFEETTKTRYSKLLDDGMRLDVTHFHDNDIYQVEVEALDCGRPKVFERCVRQVIKVLQDSPLYVPRSKFETVRRAIGGEGYFASTTASMNAKGSIAIDRTSGFSIYQGKYQKPIALTRKRLPVVLREGAYMTAKLDGARRFLVAFNGMVYDVEPEHMHVRLLCNDSPYLDPFPTIVDAELVLGTYNIFDICSFEGWYVGREKLTTRMGYAQRWLPILSNVVECKLKEYERISQDDPIGHIDEFHKRYVNGTFPIDGIVFTNEDLEYTDKVVKWKDHITIDLMVQEDGSLDDRIVPGRIDMGDVDVVRQGIYEFEVLEVTESEKDGTTLDLKALRFRGDKKIPNHSSTISNNIEAIEMRGIWSGHGCILMRQYHNAVKRKLLKKVCAKGSTVLDVGSGQGGDVSKWGRARKIHCVEPNPNAVKELKRRLREGGMVGRVDVIQCPISDAETICKRVASVDVLALFFCANFFTTADMEGLREIVAKYRPKHIVGTFLDAELIQYGSCHPCYEIVPQGDTYHIQLFGTRIDQQEYPLGMDQLRLKGYKLRDSRPLDEGELMSNNEKALSSMFRVFHLQR